MSPDRAPVEHHIVSVVHHIDRKRWSELREVFADQVETDYTSLFGGAPATQSADDLIANWRKNLGPVTTQHLLGPIDVQLEGDRAYAACHVRAMHYAPEAKSGAEWEVLGHYRFELRRTERGFRIVHMTLETFHQIGNRKLLQEAQ